jgi:predicted membrane GTPase involved in stress response
MKVGGWKTFISGSSLEKRATGRFAGESSQVAKHFTNVRAWGDGKGVQLEGSLHMTLEHAIEYIDIDEYVEPTPESLRLRKRILHATARKRAAAAA